MGPSIESLRYALEALLSSEPWSTDPGVLPIPWRAPVEIDSGTKLSFGFMDFDGVVRPHPPIMRALEMIKKALQASGHEVRTSAFYPSLKETRQLTVGRLSLGRGRHMRRQ
jgi:amidase